MFKQGLQETVAFVVLRRLVQNGLLLINDL